MSEAEAKQIERMKAVLEAQKAAFRTERHRPLDKRKADLDRIAGILDLQELDALDDPALVDIQTGDDAFGQAHADPFDLD